MTARKYRFSWNLIGDLQLGRPNLGPFTRVEVYRMMQFTFRDVMEEDLGTEKTDQLFYRAGKLAGVAFYQQYLDHLKDFHEFIKHLQQMFKDFGMGVLRMEKLDIEHGSFILTVSEDLDCSGLPELHYEMCKYDEGFIAGLLESFSGLPFQVKEVDCWCTGDRTCRFKAELVR